MAEHIINVHQGRHNMDIEDQKDEIDLDVLKKYISYAKGKVSPRLTEVNYQQTPLTQLEICLETEGPVRAGPAEL